MEHVTITVHILEANRHVFLDNSFSIEPLEILEEPVETQSITEGNHWTVTCKATAFPFPHYQWYKIDDNNLQKLHGEHKSTFEIKNIK